LGVEGGTRSSRAASAASPPLHCIRIHLDALYNGVFVWISAVNISNDEPRLNEAEVGGGLLVIRGPAAATTTVCGNAFDTPIKSKQPAAKRFPNLAHIRQSSPDSDLGFQVKFLQTFQGVPSSLGSRTGVSVPASAQAINPPWRCLLTKQPGVWFRGGV